jgi:hypothetical protein
MRFTEQVPDLAGAGGKVHPTFGMRLTFMVVLKCCSSGGEAYADLNTHVAYVE